jgi:hypothetical protein
MQHYPIYQPQSAGMIQQFLRQKPFCLLLTQIQPEPPRTGFFNPLVEDQIPAPSSPGSSAQGTQTESGSHTDFS